MAPRLVIAAGLLALAVLLAVPAAEARVTYVTVSTPLASHTFLPPNPCIGGGEVIGPGPALPPNPCVFLPPGPCSELYLGRGAGVGFCLLAR